MAEAGNPNLQNRLPREDNAPIVPFVDRPPLMEQAQFLLHTRLKVTRDGYKLDGKLVNVRDVLNAAGLKYKDEQ